MEAASGCEAESVRFGFEYLATLSMESKVVILGTTDRCTIMV